MSREGNIFMIEWLSGVLDSAATKLESIHSEIVDEKTTQRRQDECTDIIYAVIGELNNLRLNMSNALLEDIYDRQRKAMNELKNLAARESM